MDIDISGFSGKAKGRLFGKAILPPFLLACCTFLVWEIGGQYFIKHFLRHNDDSVNPCVELYFFNVFLAAVIAALISLPYLKHRFAKFNRLEYFPACYKCSHERLDGEAICPKCGTDLKVKHLAAPVETMNNWGRRYILRFLLLLLFASVSSMTFFKAFDAWNYERMVKKTIISTTEKTATADKPR